VECSVESVQIMGKIPTGLDWDGGTRGTTALPRPREKKKMRRNSGQEGNDERSFSLHREKEKENDAQYYSSVQYHKEAYTSYARCGRSGQAPSVAALAPSRDS